MRQRRTDSQSSCQVHYPYYCHMDAYFARNSVRLVFRLPQCNFQFEGFNLVRCRCQFSPGRFGVGQCKCCCGVPCYDGNNFCSITQHHKLITLLMFFFWHWIFPEIGIFGELVMNRLNTTIGAVCCAEKLLTAAVVRDAFCSLQHSGGARQLLSRNAKFELSDRRCRKSRQKLLGTAFANLIATKPVSRQPRTVGRSSYGH